MEDVFLRVGNELEADDHDIAQNGVNGHKKDIMCDNLLQKVPHI